MKRLQGVIIVLMIVGLSSCRKDSVQSKIMEGIPINTEETIIPGQAIQEYHLLIKEAMSKVVMVINRLGRSDADYSDLTPVAPRYSFSLTNNHFGQATVLIEFKDVANGSIYPIVGAATTTVKSVDVIVTGNSSRFTFSLPDGKMTLEIAGDNTSEKTTTGIFNVNGLSYNIDFTIAAPGAKTTYQGFYSGVVSVSGTGVAAAPLVGHFEYTMDHDLDGELTWDDRTGGVHFFDNGTGFINSDNEKFLFE